MAGTDFHNANATLVEAMLVTILTAENKSDGVAFSKFEDKGPIDMPTVLSSVCWRSWPLMVVSIRSAFVSSYWFSGSTETGLVAKRRLGRRQRRPNLVQTVASGKTRAVT